MALQYLAKRLLLAIPVVFFVSVVVFGLMHFLPGDPAVVMLSQFGGTAEDLRKLQEELGLNRPVYVQFVDFLWSALHGDLGRSLFNRRPVLDQILVQVPSTLQLTGSAIVVAVVIGVPLGIISALKRGTWTDGTIMMISLLGVSVPNFWLGLALMLVFSLILHWFPATGSGTFRQLVLPAFALGLASAGLIARLVRSNMLEVLHQDYMRTARAKGLSEMTVVIRHGMKNSLIPVITILGLTISQLLAGSVVIETVFARQGLGRMVIWAILQKDFPLVQGTVLFITVAYVFINIIVDWTYSLADPRIRSEVS